MTKAIIKLFTKLPDTGEEVLFYLLTNSDAIRVTPKEIIEKDMRQWIKQVNVKAPMAMSSVSVSYSLEENPEQIDYGNTLIDINLPYYLHLPNRSEYEITLPELSLKAKILTTKVWTTKAAGSSPIDFFAEDRVVYFNNGNMITPQLPYNAELGWDLGLTGQNVEKSKDNNGHFRFTRLQILLNTSYTKEQLESKKSSDQIYEEIETKVFAIVNRLLDVYRYITKQEHVERLGSIIITNIYFYETNWGLYPVSMPIENATINRSKQEIDAIKSFLKNGDLLPLYELLLLNAQSSLNKKMYTLAVVSSFQGLEIFLENLIIEKLSIKGLSSKDIEQKLDQKWKTKDRLKDLLKESIGHSILEERALWDKWCAVYDQVRNEIIHRGKNISENETRNTLKLNEDIIGRIKNWV